MKILTIRSGFNHIANILFPYFGERVYSLDITKIDYSSPLEEEIFRNTEIDFVFLNFLHNIELTCETIKKIKELSPETKIIFVSSTAEHFCKEIFSAGATACIKG